MKSEEFFPNPRLRSARFLKGWSQSELAEQVGTSFEMVSRWERGITLPSPYYRERLCVALGKSAEELGLMNGKGALTPSPLVLLACCHQDMKKAIVSHLKVALQERGVSFWSSRMLRQGSENSPVPLRSVRVILVVLSPEARSSRHVREALELARGYQRPVCAVWIEGEHWQECLPKGIDEVAVVIDARGREAGPLQEEIILALQRVGLALHRNAIPSFSQDQTPAAMIQPSDPQEKEYRQVITPSADSFEFTTAPLSLPDAMPLPSTSALPLPRKGVARSSTVLRIGLAMLVIASAVLASTILLSHLGRRSAPITPVRGGTWTLDYIKDPDSLLPNRGDLTVFHYALYLPLFYGDAFTVVHPGAATEVPSLQNGGISPDAKTWTFHLRPHLVWSDGYPYDARDVDFTWRLWLTPGFSATNTTGLNLISSADVSADYLTITFHLKQPFAPFMADLWVDGPQAPLPAHHFRGMTPEAILKSPDNLDPTVTSGPFMMAESKPGDHYTFVRNPRYYQASQGLPYLDKVVFRIVADNDVIRKDLQADAIDSTALVDPYQLQLYQRFTHYRLVTLSSSSNFEAIYFNFHNTVLASHLEVRQAIARAINHQALIEAVPSGFATELCTDHPSAIHPGYQPTPNCPIFSPAAANKLLDDSGWAKGPDGVRARNGQRLEFEYSTSSTFDNIGRASAEVIVQRNLQAIGIQLDIQNYPHDIFFGPFLNGGKASPATGAVAGRFDIAEWEQGFGYDPDDSFVLGCDQFPPKGINWTFYCNQALDALYRQEQATVDVGVRQQIFDQIHRIYLRDFPFIVLYSSLDPTIVRKGTHNYQASPIAWETFNIWEWWCDNGKC